MCHRNWPAPAPAHTTYSPTESAHLQHNAPRTKHGDCMAINARMLAYTLSLLSLFFCCMWVKGSQVVIVYARECHSPMPQRLSCESLQEYTNEAAGKFSNFLPLGNDATYDDTAAPLATGRSCTNGGGFLYFKNQCQSSVTVSLKAGSRSILPTALHSRSRACFGALCSFGAIDGRQWRSQIRACCSSFT